MFDLNAIVSAALNAAVQQAVAPLVERIDALEKNEEYLTRRITALENNPAIGVDTTLEKRVAVLEGAPSVLEDWDIGRLVQRITALESETQGENRYLNRDEVNDLIQEAMDDHLGTYDHDEYDNHINDDDKHFDGDIEDAVRDALNGTSVTLSF